MTPLLHVTLLNHYPDQAKAAVPDCEPERSELFTSSQQQLPHYSNPSAVHKA